MHSIQLEISSMFATLKGLRKEVLVMFIGSFALLIVIQIVNYYGVQAQDEAKAQLIRSNVITRNLETLVSHLKDVETGIRGYALTDKPEFLEPFLTGVPNVQHDFVTLKEQIRDTQQLKELEKLRELAKVRIDIAEKVVAMHRTEGRNSAQRLIAEGTGKQAMDAVRAQADLMIQREDALSDEAEFRSRTATNFSRILFVAGFLIVMLMQSLAFIIVIRESQQRRQAEIAVNNLNTSLEAHVKELDNEISERRKAEASVQSLNSQLEAQLAQLNESNTALNSVNKELESFAYSVSHDLRSPLRGLDGLSLALLEDYGDKIDDTGKGFLTRMRSESQRMGELIDGILALSRLTRGEVHKEKLNLSEIAQEVVDDLRRQEPDRQNVEVSIKPDVIAQGDPRLIEAVMMNLINNAWKFTSKHEKARIEFSTFLKDDKIVYYVRDDGAGFDMSYIDKMFGAFQRLHGIKEFVGTGIGLATVQRIIHRHGGVIWAEGEIEKGATFYFTLN